MFEDLLMQLDELGVTYTEDEMGTLTIDIADVDKSILIDVIITLNDGGYMFDITETSITVEGGESEEALEEEDTAYSEDMAFEEALATM